MVNNPFQSVPKNIGSETISKQNKQSISDFTNNPNEFGRLRRWSGSPGAEPLQKTTTDAKFVTTDSYGNDWRVKLSVPTISTFRQSPVLSPLQRTDYQVVFPVTPNITLVSTAQYGSADPVHSNYPFPEYVNSRTEDINITGEFPVQNITDGQYWLAAVHYFRSVTKMFYGESSERGAPPQIEKLNGYGDYVLNNVPVVVTTFTIDLNNQVDYIEVPVMNNAFDIFGSKYQMVPTMSTLSITVKPIYSRRKVASFSLDRFIRGDLNDKGFI